MCLALDKCCKERNTLPNHSVLLCRLLQSGKPQPGCCEGGGEFSWELTSEWPKTKLYLWQEFSTEIPFQHSPEIYSPRHKKRRNIDHKGQKQITPIIRMLLPSSQFSPLYPGLQMQVPTMHVPCPLQVTSMHWLVGTSHSDPFQPLWHMQRPFRYWPFPLQRTGQDAVRRANTNTLDYYLTCQCEMISCPNNILLEYYKSIVQGFIKKASFLKYSIRQKLQKLVPINLCYITLEL